MIRLSSSITFYKTLLGIQTVTAISETTIQLEYDNIAGTSNPVTLLLEYDPTSRRLIDARVSFPMSDTVRLELMIVAWY
jgi:hypothetical protein